MPTTIGMQWLLLAVGTFASEDLTCVTAGELLRRGDLSWETAVGGCLLGVYVGDLALWLLGRSLGASVLGIPWISARVTQKRLASFQNWIERHEAKAIIVARFVPGTRLPTYLAAGAIRRNGLRFAILTFVANLLWVPLIVLVVARAGDSATRYFTTYLGSGISIVIAILASVALVKFVGLLSTPLGRAKAIARISKLWRWEYWPTWAFYSPVIPYIGWLSIRHRSVSIITAANPGIPHGGFVGESKFQILSSLRGTFVSPTIILPVKPIDERMTLLRSANWSYPLILKPDVGQRGAGVKLARTEGDARDYLLANRFDVIAQPFDPGPFEAGVFYFRHPDEPTGHIFSITDKIFPAVVGNGISTLEELIWQHPRYRMQAGRFLKRYHDSASTVPGVGETVRLALAGNHCQGTMFVDGGHLITAELERAVDRIAQRLPGFHFGRFDIRYADIEAFMAGKSFTAIELNGITSESTNLYDPSWTLWRAYRTLIAQWQLLFKIAAANQAAGALASTHRQLFRDLVSYSRQPKPRPLAD